eukprot:scaffold21407_cov112-Isochrysis_galbana.AAC.1
MPPPRRRAAPTTGGGTWTWPLPSLYSRRRRCSSPRDCAHEAASPPTPCRTGTSRDDGHGFMVRHDGWYSTMDRQVMVQHGRSPPSRRCSSPPDCALRPLRRRVGQVPAFQRGGFEGSQAAL